MDACSLVFLLCGADGYCSITVAKYGLGRFSSRDLQPIRAKKFVNKFYLILHACVQTFDVTFFGVKFWDINPPIQYGEGVFPPRLIFYKCNIKFHDICMGP